MTSVRYLFLALLGLAGCATSFTGSAYVDGGAAGCRAKCTEWDLEFGGMVAMGEYSDACLCVPREKDGAAEPGSQSASAAAGAAVGVVLQTRESERRSRGYR